MTPAVASSPLLTVDVAHPPRPAAVVEQDLQDALRRVYRSPALRVLKIIHGYGSTGKGSRTRDVVLNWLYRQGPRVKTVIAGADYGILHPDTGRLRAAVGQYPDMDLDASNRGITVVWVR